MSREKTDCAIIKKVPHDNAFAPDRACANRDFFRINVEQAVNYLELFNHEDVNERIEGDLSTDDKAASKKAKFHNPSLNFIQMQLNKGDKLAWQDVPAIRITIFTERTVVFNREKKAISIVTRDIKKSKWFRAISSLAI